MQGVIEFPTSAAGSLIEGYCADFISLAATLAQTLEQIAMRGISVAPNRQSLERIEHGMRELAAAIHELLQRQATPTGSDAVRAAVPAAREQEPVAPPRAAQSVSSEPRPTAPAAPAAAAAPRPRALAPASAGRDGLCGSNSTLPLQSVFQFLGRMRMTGTLTVELGDETLTFELLGGFVDATATDRDHDGERLGAILVESGWVRPADIELALQRAGKSSGHRLGEVLVKERVISHGQLVEALERQVHKRFHRAITAPSAEYWFVEHKRRPARGHVKIAPFELLHASRRMAEPGGG